MRPISFIDVFFAFVLGFLAGGQPLVLPNIGLPSWVWPIGAAPPFKTDSLAVLIVEESTPGDGNAPPWANSTKSGGVRDYVEMTRKGKLRLIDKDNASDLVDQKWKDAFAAKGSTVPWIVAAGPRTGASQSLPQTEAETLKLLEGVK